MVYHIFYTLYRRQPLPHQRQPLPRPETTEHIALTYRKFVPEPKLGNYATGRRFTGPGQGHGFHAGHQHSIRIDPSLLVLLRIDSNMGSQYRSDRPHPFEFQQNVGIISFFAIHKDLCRIVPFTLMYRDKRDKGQFCNLEENRADTRYRICLFLS